MYLFQHRQHWISFYTIDGFIGEPTPIETLNELLSDRDFYEFLEDVSFKKSQVKSVLNGYFDRSHMGNINVEGCFIWDLQKCIEEFILKQLVKHGLSIEERMIKINRLESKE